MLSFEDHFQACKELIDAYLERHWATRAMPRSTAVQKLKESIEYSSLRGGKRFRPVLSLLVSDSFGVGPNVVLPFAAAVEMIHTYSLIHDDLPCMDNDDVRRGEPTNHKVFGESTALLAGDALLTEAFVLLAEAYSKKSELGLQLITLLGDAAGFSGMVAGQAIDLAAKDSTMPLAELNLMHAMKTGALIRVAVEGAAVVMGLPGDQREKCREFGSKLGLAFQLKDDLIDSQGEIEKGSFPALLGVDETAAYLSEVTQGARAILLQLNIRQGPLHEILEMNLRREK